MAKPREVLENFNEVLSIDPDEPVQQGSWGLVYMVRDMNSSVFGVKLARKDQVPFVTGGVLAEQLLAEEVGVGLKQGEVGLAPVLGLMRGAIRDGKIYPASAVDEDGESMVVMPWFPPQTSGLLTVMNRGELARDDEAKLAIMTNIMERIKVMREPVDADQIDAYGSVEGMARLIIDERMRHRASDTTYPFCEAARVVNQAVIRELGRLRQLINQRVGEEKFGAQHGDPRPENVVVVRNGGETWRQAQAPILDAVRLAMITPDHPEGRVMEEWYMTDVILQAGMLLGTFLAKGVKGYTDWFKAGVRAYEQVIEPIVGNKQLEKLFGIALEYGMSVEVHVLGYQWDENLKKWQELVAANGWEEFGRWPIEGLPRNFMDNWDRAERYFNALKEADYYLFPLTMKEEMKKHWMTMEELADSGFLGWKEALNAE